MLTAIYHMLKNATKYHDLYSCAEAFPPGRQPVRENRQRKAGSRQPVPSHVPVPKDRRQSRVFGLQRPRSPVIIAPNTPVIVLDRSESCAGSEVARHNQLDD